MRQTIRKVLTLTLALVLFLSMAACGSKAESEQTISQSEQSPSQSEQLSSDDSIEPSEPNTDKSSLSSSEPVVLSSESASSSTETEMDEQESIQYDFYSWNPADYTYHLMNYRDDSEKLRTLLLSLKQDETAVPDKNSKEKLGFLVYMEDGSKSTYYITPTQVYDKDEHALKATAEQCQMLYDAAKQCNIKYKGIPQWLVYMSLERITEVRFKGAAQDNVDEDISLVTKDKDAIESIWRVLRNVKVEPGCTKRAEFNFDAPADLMTMSLTFDSGVTYDIFLQGKTLGIKSSDMDYTLSYTVLFEQNKLRTVAEDIHCKLTNPAPSKEKDNPATGKPVIYLYPTAKTDVTVKLDFGGELWYTYPAYNNGWHVTAYPDGRLINKADGTEHFYLFWDGNSDTKWRFDEGFCVAGSELEPFLREKLAYMGLTPREYNDFITFWVPKLQGNAYNLITFVTTQYEQLAPLTVTPKPDSVLRVHMVYKALAHPVSIPEQKLTAFERKGFTLVEWGGSRA